jgi:hypothetical protein
MGIFRCEEFCSWLGFNYDGHTNDMPTTEQSINAEYAKIFVASDWHLFKRMAEAQFREAAFLKKKDMHINQVLKLLARNSRKRLLIGIGTELLLKAVYLRNGYCINEPESKGSIAFPFTQEDASRAATSLVAAKTVMLGEMIDHSTLHVNPRG